jgi:D-alanine-D-alanine ligase-like ATP-grasp enzyme
MNLNPFDPVTRVRLLRRQHQLKTLVRAVLGGRKQAERPEVLQKIQREGVRAAGAGQLGFVQDGSSFQREFYREMWRSAAEEIGAEFNAIDGSVWDVSCNGRATRLNLHQTELDNPVALTVAGDKALCHKILAEGGLPVPDHLVFAASEIGAAHRFVRQHGGFFVVKPADGTSSARGVTTFVRSEGDCTRAAAVASAYSSRILIERVVPGELYRLLVLRGRVIHAIRRPGVRVEGDGRSAIRQLVVRALQRSSASPAGEGRVDLEQDNDLAANLHAQNLDLESIPAAGRTLVVKSYPSLMGKGVEEVPTYGEDVTAVLGPEVKALAAKAAGLIRSEFAGVELITPDTRTPLQIGVGRIIEINTTPGLGPHFDLAIHSGAPNPTVLVLRSLLAID